MTRIACVLCLLTALIHAATDAVQWAAAQQRRLTTCTDEPLAAAKRAISPGVAFLHGADVGQ